MKSIIVFCLIILSAGQVAAAIKDCEELKAEIAAKLVANGVSSFSLAIVDKDRTGDGKIIGRCQGGTKRIVRLPATGFMSGAGRTDAPALSAVTIAYGIENGPEREAHLPASGSLSGAGPADIPSLPSVTFAYRIKDCEELKSEIAAKLTANGVSSFFLDIVDKDRTGAGKIIGRCENGTKRIIRRKDS